MTGPESGEDQRPGPWGPDERVGDIHAADPGPDRQAERAERLTEAPSVWVGSWLDYNSCILHGAWIDAVQDEAALQADIAAMLAGSPTTAETGEPAEDWGIFDYDNFGSLRIGEQEALSWVSAVARGIAEHGLAFAAYADIVEDEDALAGFEGDYLGRYDSLQDYAQQYVDDAGYGRLLDAAVPKPLRPYVRIDTGQLARDMQLGGDIHALPADEGGVWVFQGR